LLSINESESSFLVSFKNKLEIDRSSLITAMDANNNINIKIRVIACSNDIPISSGSSIGNIGGPHSLQNSPLDKTLAPQVEQKQSGIMPSDSFFFKAISNNKPIRV
jgi:hypothetical protein